MTPTFPRIYHDGQSLYLEFPKHCLRFPFTEGGLHKALRHIPSIQSAPGYVTGASNLLKKATPTVKIAKATQRKRELSKFSDDTKRAAMATIRKLGLGD